MKHYHNLIIQFSIQLNIWDFVTAQHGAAQQIDILQNILAPTFPNHQSMKIFDTKNRLKNRPRVGLLGLFATKTLR